jgi:UDP-glucose 4-epimerase
VSDTVRGIASALEAEMSGEIVNIGNCQEISINELARTIHRLCGTEAPLKVEYIPYDEISGRRYEDVRRRVPDTSKAKLLLGFEAKVPLESGLEQTIAWQRAYSLELSASEALTNIS